MPEIAREINSVILKVRPEETAAEHLAAGNINLVNARVVTNLVIAAELSEQLLVPLTAQQLIQAVNLVAVILAQAVILKQTPEVVMR